MTRYQADALLLITALIWGSAFVAQKSAMEVIGPFTFVGFRFLLSALFIAPFILINLSKSKLKIRPFDKYLLLSLCFAFIAGVVLQQVGMLTTNVTNAGFLTSLYVIFTPFITLIIFRTSPSKIIWGAAPFCLFGVWLLGDGSLSALNQGDFLVIGSAFFFAIHTVLISFVVLRTGSPLTLALLQYSACAFISLIIAFQIETISIEALQAVTIEICYAGILSGGVAYTLQIVAQQHTPPSDAAVILSGEALFAALAGVIIMQDNLTTLAWTGCTVIFASILLVELYPVLKKKIRNNNISN